MKQLIHQIHDELDTACEYIKCAAQKDGDAKDIYRTLSKEELTHAEKLMSLGDQYAVALHAEDSHKIIWAYEKENFRDRYIKLKAEWSMLG